MQIITTSTLQSFTDKPITISPITGLGDIWVPPSVLGPFFRVDPRDDFEKVFKESFSRVDKLREFGREHSSVLSSDFEHYLERFRDYVEMDGTFAMFHEIKRFVHESAHEALEKVFKKTASGRWVGLTDPKNLEDAKVLYNLYHLKEKPLYVHKIQINLTHLDVRRHSPCLFFGKVAGGTSFQLKLNNHCLDYIETLGCCELH